MGQGGFGRIAAVGLLLAAALGGASCGTSNDQGISFRALGWFAEDEGGQFDTQDPTGDIGRSVGLACEQAVRSYIGLENNLVQGINLARVEFGYRIPGGALNLPESAQPVSQRLGTSSGQEFQSPLQFAQVRLLSPAQLEFLNQNRNRLPEFPFRMIVIARAVGVADSGDVFITNDISYPIDVFDDDFCELPGEQPIPGPDPDSDPQATVAPFQTPAPNPQPTPIL